MADLIDCSDINKCIRIDFKYHLFKNIFFLLKYSIEFTINNGNGMI
jgi:hypothetical protein